MAILSYVIAASPLQKSVDRRKLEAFIWELFHEQFLTFPSAIFVGEARNNVDPVENEHCWEYIVPNQPDSMLNVMKTLLKGDVALPIQQYAWYIGNDEMVFKQLFDCIPFGEQDCCLCFAANQARLSGWEGAVIYVLTHPVPMKFMDPIHSEYRLLLEQPLTHYFSLYCPRGLWVERDDNSLKLLLETYFGSDLILVQSVSPDSPFWKE